MKKEKLEELLDNHDCHLSAEDGCSCIEIRQELAKLNYKLKTVPYKHHKLIMPEFTRDLEEAKWNEVRGDRI